MIDWWSWFGDVLEKFKLLIKSIIFDQFLLTFIQKMIIAIKLYLKEVLNISYHIFLEKNCVIQSFEKVFIFFQFADSGISSAWIYMNPLILKKMVLAAINLEYYSEPAETTKIWVCSFVHKSIFSWQNLVFTTGRSQNAAAHPLFGSFLY